jgi:hypothetical protein
MAALQRKRTTVYCALLGVGSLLLYARSLEFGFVNFDDFRVLLAHPNLYNEQSLLGSLYEIFFGYFPREEPLLVRDVSWAFDARIFGFDNPTGYHLGNVGINAANVVLLFAVLLRFTGRISMALWVAGLFAIVPVHVEPVCWVMGRKDLLSAFFVLSALLAQTFELETSDPSRRRTCYLLSILLTGLAVLAKMGGVSCFVLLALHRALHPYLDGRKGPADPLDLRVTLRSAVWPVLPHATLTAAIALWYGRIVSEFGVTGWRGLGPLEPQHLANVATFAPLSIGQYLKQTFWSSQHSLYYRWPHVEIPLTTGEALAAVMIAAGLAAFTLYCFSKRKDLAFYLLAFYACLLPYLNLIYVGIWRADRYIYLGSFCLLAIAVSCGLQLYRSRGIAIRYAVAGLAMAMVLNFLFKNWQQQAVWADNGSLWKYEAYRDEPSLLSIQELAKHFIHQANIATDPSEVRALASAARHEIARGFEREAALGRVPAPYATSEQLQLSHLHYLFGRLDMLEKAPLESQIRHFEASHDIAPDPTNTLMLAGAYFNLAADAPHTEQEELVHRSLDFFEEHVHYSKSDPVRTAKNMTLLSQNYEANYPFLQERIQRMRSGL